MKRILATLLVVSTILLLAAQCMVQVPASQPAASEPAAAVEEPAPAHFALATNRFILFVVLLMCVV
jgi:hypothetical protein